MQTPETFLANGTNRSLRSVIARVCVCTLVVSCSDSVAIEMGHTAVSVPPATSDLNSEPDIARQEELAYLLEQDCGSCHGLTLNGGLGSPLTRAALQGKPTEYLFAVIRNGIPGTPMPPWSALLDDNEIRWIVQLLENEGVSR